jgi:2-polyprenyl-6-methoxyphenol hydroxylase-like FAD-dependent oxidoreductase
VVETSHLIHTEGNAWHMNRLRFDAALATAAATRGAVLLTGTRLTDIRPTVGHWELTLDNGARTPTKLRVGFLVEASGRGAGLARRLGARRILFDRLVGVAASQLLLLSVERHLLVEACSDGWWSSAPAGAGQLVTTLMSDSDLIGGAGRDAVAYLRRRSAASLTSARLENSELLWGPRVFSAVSQRLQRSEYQLPWLAVGDAALSLDPLSGRGVTRALTGAACAARAVGAFLDGGGPLVLREYEHELDRACTQYLLERPFFYGGERRWPNAPFWRRRLAVCDRLTAQSAGGARPPNVSAPPSLNPAGETPRYGDPAMSIDA